MDDRFLTVREAADFLNCTPKHVHALIRRGELRSLKLGRYRRVRLSWLEEFVQIAECAS